MCTSYLLITFYSLSPSLSLSLPTHFAKILIPNTSPYNGYIAMVISNYLYYAQISYTIPKLVTPYPGLTASLIASTRARVDPLPIFSHIVVCQHHENYYYITP